jgi:hypothetical protein
MEFQKKIFGGYEPCRNRVVVPARQATAGGIDALESIPGLLKNTVHTVFLLIYCLFIFTVHTLYGYVQHIFTF